MAEPKDEGFKVVDRRLFTEQGDLRKEAVEQERRDEEAASKKADQQSKIAASRAASTAPAADAAHGGNTAAEDALAAEPAEPAEPEDAVASSRSFQMLINFLTRNAAAMLGGMADPRTGQPFVDIEGAREMIDMLDVLREKTMGNLAKADSDLLIEVLGSLKLTYMEISKAAAEAMAKKGMKTGG